MKKFLLLLGLLAALLPTFAQHVRNKPFDPTLNSERLTSDEIIRLFGKPERSDSAMIDKGPVLIVVDCSELNYLLNCLYDENHRIKSLR